MNQNTETILFLGGLIIGAVAWVCLVAYITGFLIEERTRSKHKSEFRVALKSGLDKGLITTLEDLVNVYKGILSISTDDVAFQEDLAKELRKLLASIAISEETMEAIVQRKSRISALLTALDRESPFASLPSAERAVLRDIREAIAASNTAQAHGKLNDLAGLIASRKDAFEKLQAANRWSVPLAIIGLVLTLIFGFTSSLPSKPQSPPTTGTKQAQSPIDSNTDHQ